MEKPSKLTVTTPSFAIDFLDRITIPATLFDGFAFILIYYVLYYVNTTRFYNVLCSKSILLYYLLNTINQKCNQHHNLLLFVVKPPAVNQASLSAISPHSFQQQN